MRFEPEKDIEAFKGRNWREKWVLQNRARERDPWILRLQLLISVLIFGPIMSASFWVASHFFSHFQLLAAIVIGIIVACPIDMALGSFFIVPRIRRALDSDKRTDA